jgi:hypothetical protein
MSPSGLGLIDSTSDGAAQRFDEVVGQEAVVRTLQNAIEHERVRQAAAAVGPRCDAKSPSQLSMRLLVCGTNTRQGKCSRLVRNRRSGRK